MQKNGFVDTGILGMYSRLVILYGQEKAKEIFRDVSLAIFQSNKKVGFISESGGRSSGSGKPGHA